MAEKKDFTPADVKYFLSLYPLAAFRLWKSYAFYSSLQTIDEKESFRCSIELANDLIKDGKNPKVLRFLPLNPGEKLVPGGYNNRLKWDFHYADFCDDLIFDPIYHRPLELEEYIGVLFNSPVRVLNENCSPREIKDRLSSGNFSIY